MGILETSHSSDRGFGASFLKRHRPEVSKLLTMPGKHVIGLVADLKRENEGEYIIPMCTVFGLEDEERIWLIQNQQSLDLVNQLTDKNKEHDGIEIAPSVYKVMRILGKQFGFEPAGKPEVGCQSDCRTTLIYTLTKDV